MNRSSPPRYGDRPSDRLALREYTDEIMYEIAQLSGYEYVDTYATRQADGISSEVAHVASYAEADALASAAS